MLKKITKKLFSGIFFEVLVFLIALTMGFYFQWEVANFVFFMLFIFLILHPVSSRFAAGGAIVFLSATAILLVFKQNNLAESTAIWAYYLMIFTAMLSFNELQEEKEEGII